MLAHEDILPKATFLSSSIAACGTETPRENPAGRVDVGAAAAAGIAAIDLGLRRLLDIAAASGSCGLEIGPGIPHWFPRLLQSARKAGRHWQALSPSQA